MEIPQIRLHSTPLKLGLTIEQPIQRIEQPQAELHIEQPAAIVEIRTKPGQLLIDQSEARAQEGFKTIPRLVSDAADKGYQDVLKGIARVARQGWELMQIQNGGNPIVAHAKQNSEGPEKQFNIGWIPSHFSVKLQYEPAEVNVDVSPQEPIIEVEVNKPIIDYTPGNVAVDVAEKNSLDIKFINIFPENNE